MEQACLLTLSKPIIVYSPHTLNLLCHVVIVCCGGTPDVEAKLLVLPELLSSKQHLAKEWTCFEAVAARLSRCPIYFLDMSPNLPAEFFAKPSLPFGGKCAKITFCRCLCQPIFLSHGCDNAVVCHGSNYLLLVQHQICLFHLPEIEVRVRGCPHTVLQMFRNYGSSFCFCMCRDVNPYCLHWHYYMSVAWFWRITCIAFQEAYQNVFFMFL